ncbi:DUF4430 domain-containing protein [Clostridium algidicarnis]|uniref:DUF4430 domain-containing protein n=1 Tax=Clostridium algidicarnis TaxID=37659 RepID=UPI0006912F92|nr:DUF4430 domain-containing protein [Clostridium algidicarnis]
MKKKNLTLKKMLSVLLVAFMFFGISASAISNTFKKASDSKPKGYVTVSMEKFTLGLGYIVEPVKVPIYENTRVSEVITNLLGEGNYRITGEIDKGFYLASVKDKDKRKVNIPQYILDECGDVDEDRTEDDWLGEFDYTSMSGWMYSVNNKFPNFGAAEYYPKDGDVIRWQFTVYGYGSDIGGGFEGDATSGSFEGSYKPIANKGELTAKLAEINSSKEKAAILSKAGVQAAYDKAYRVAQVVDSSQESVDQAFTTLDNAVNGTKPGNPEDPEKSTNPEEPSKPEEPAKSIDLIKSNPSIETAIDETAALMYKNTPNPVLGTLGGEWTMLSLARAGYTVPEEYYEKYYINVANELKEKGGVLHKVKYTEYSRVILGLTAIGKDVTNVAGYNLLEKLADFNSVKKQGINGPIFALIALDTNNYEIPIMKDVKVQTTRDILIDYILDLEITDKNGVVGGWALTGKTPDPDITGMALQSLAKYKNDEKVKPYIDRAVKVLANLQNDKGGYSSWGSVNSESIAQVIVALTALGIDPSKDTRFVKGEGSWVISAIMDFYVSGGGFKHVLDQEINGMATDQGMYAIVAYDRFVNGKNSLYDMTDAKEVKSLEDKAVISAPERINGNKGTEFKMQVKLGSWPEGNFKLLESIINIPDSIEITEVSMSDSMSGGLPDFGVEDGKLRTVYTNTGLKDISFKPTEFPSEVMTITAKLTEDLQKDTKLSINIEDLTLKAGSDSSKTNKFDVSKSEANIIIGEQLTANARQLYKGDGVDLIPGSKSAIAVEFTNLIDTPHIMLNDNITMLHSKEISDKTGITTYVALVDTTVALDGLKDINRYDISSKKKADTLKFGDSNGDNTVNAQDALNTLSGWLRKTGTPDNNSILSMNVTGDSRIDTYDVLSMMEAYVNGIEYKVIGK